MPTQKNKLAQGVETLISRNLQQSLEFDVVIIGSGYGGAVAASRLARAHKDGKPLRICLLERGREFQAGDFPSDFARLPAEVRFETEKSSRPLGFASGLFDFHFNEDVSILRGNGLGGGSLINASVVERMAANMWQAEQWPHQLRVGSRQFEVYYQRVEKMLAAKPMPRETWPAKTWQLEKLGQHIDKIELKKMPKAQVLSSSFRAVNLALNQKDQINRYGIQQQACVQCGDCFTGCNFNAKNSLNLNYLPDARQRGVEMYTGATVRYLSPLPNTETGEPSWQVHFGLTEAPNANARAHTFVLRSKMVVLAAGTLGSTEILLRSQEQGMKFSKTLGSRFSANGDMIWAGYAQAGEVRPGANEFQAYAERKVGPTITAMLDLRERAQHPQVVQDAAVPAALYRVFSELVTTSNLLYRMTKPCPDEFTLQGQDPDAISAQQLAHTAVYLSMGVDDAAGKIDYVAKEDDRGDTVKVTWQHPEQNGLYSETEQYLQQGVAQLNGVLIPSPNWRAYPEELDAALSGKKPPPHLITVHPLGGCAMGNNVKIGVVNHIGAVFDTVGKRTVYPDLYVWDGSIVPLAIGINPLLTIAALAERAVEKCAQLHGWAIDYDGQLTSDQIQAATSQEITAPALPPEPAQTVMKFSEVMKGDLQLRGAATVKGALQVDFRFAVELQKFLSDPKRSVKISDAVLRLGDGEQIAMQGEVAWLHLVPQYYYRKVARGLSSYVRLRAWPDALGRALPYAKNGKITLWHVLKGLSGKGKLKDFCRLASHTGGLRQLRYTLTPKEGQNTRFGQSAWVLHGVKNVEYKPGNNLWASLSNLQVEIKTKAGTTLAQGVLKLDWHKLLSEKSMQIVSHNDNTAAILDMANMAGFFLRAIFRIHFWNLRRPDYSTKPRRFPRPGPLAGLCAPEWHATEVSQLGAAPDADPVAIEVTRYRAQGRPASEQPPVLLIHGFGASGLQFTTDAMEQNLTQFLCQQGREVWVLELRTSIALHTSGQQWKLDEVAQNDIPSAVKFVLAQYGGKFAALDVLAHCIGSAMLNIAVLSGRLQHDGKSLIRSAVMLQVGPIFKVSSTNLIRGEAAKLMRDLMNFDSMDSSVDEASSKWQDGLLDRLLATHPLPAAEEALLRPRWNFQLRTDIANYLRSTGVFGRLFELDNLSQEMRENLGDLLGTTNLTTYQQILHSLLAKCLVDQYGRNVYVTDQNFASFYRFPALFIHGEQNDVFDVQCTGDSVQRLREIFSEEDFEHLTFEEFGHLDPLVGKNAAAQIFPAIQEFLNKPHSKAVLPKAQTAAVQRLPAALGPILGWTRQDAQPAHHLCRIWLKTAEVRQATHCVESLLIDPAGQLVRGSYRQHPILAWPRFTIAVFDVAVPSAPGYRVLLCSRHHAQPHPTPCAPSSDLIPALPSSGELQAALRKPSPLSGTWQQEEDEMWQHYLAQPAQFSLLQARLPEKSADELCFALGSCRYSGGPLEDYRGDLPLQHLLDHLQKRADTSAQAWQPELCLMMGDQIYVDATAGVLERKPRTEVILERYEEAYRSPAARELFASLPVYKAMDDHEIGNDWEPSRQASHASHASNAKWDQVAQAAFVAYQWAHSPRNAQIAVVTATDDAAPPPQHLWYDFENSGLPFFVMDCRLERAARHHSLRDPQANLQMHSAAQMKALELWLCQQQRQHGDKPKFLVAASAMAPIANEQHDGMHLRGDGWFAYPDSMRQLTDILITHGIQNLVLLSGDLHASFASEIELSNPQGQTAKIFALVFSPIYAPYSFINGDSAAMCRAMAQELACSPPGYQFSYEVVWANDTKQGFGLIRVKKEAGRWCLEYRLVAGEQPPQVKVFA